MLPTFIGIGPGRTGTSMLYEALRAHPEVFMARGTKETNFFTLEYHRGLVWYEAFFKASPGIRALGEISNAYFYDPAVPARIAQVLPDIRLFTCLRNPFDRLRSVYYYRKRAGTIPPDLPLDMALRRYADLTSDSCYATNLQAYYRYFDQDQLLILFYDDLLADPDRFIERLFAFTGVGTEFRPEVLYRRVNESAEVRARSLGKLAAGTAGFLRRWGMLRVLDWAKRSRFIRRVLLAPIADEGPDPALHLHKDTLERLLETWTPELEQVARWTRRPLDHWLQHPA